MTESSTAVLSEAVRLNADGVYPEAYFRQRLDEEAHRAHRMHGILTLLLIQGDIPTLAHSLREGIRRMDVLGLWKGFLAVILAEIPREEVAPGYVDRLSQQVQGVLRVAGILDTEWQEIYLGACLVPDQKGGKIDPGQLLVWSEKALLESSQEHQPILYKGAKRFVDTPRKDHVSSLIRYGDLHLQKDSFKGWIGPQTVEFLPKELDLLQYLLKHEGKLIKRDNLCKAVWGYDYFGNTRTVDMHIAKLRKKLKSSRSLSIRTLKGEGYRLDLNS